MPDTWTFGGLKLRVSYTDPWNDTVVDVPGQPVKVEDNPAAAGLDLPAELVACTTRGFRGRVICVCGRFPDTAIRNALAIGGRPLGAPISASNRVLYVRLPGEIQPGQHTITLPGTSGSASIEVLPMVTV